MTLVYGFEAIFKTFAIFALLIGIKLLPLTYVIIILNVTLLLYSIMEKLYSVAKIDTYMFLLLSIALVTVIFGLSSTQLIV